VIKINKRSIVGCILLSIITLGIYGIYWMYLLVKNTRSIQKDTYSCTEEVLCLIFVPFYSIYWWYTRGKKVKQSFKENKYTAKGNGVLYLVLAILGLNIVSMAIMQSDFNSLKPGFCEECPGRKLSNNFAGWLFILPAIILMYLFVWRPTVMGFVWSLFKMKGYTPKNYIGLQNYIEVMKDTQFIPLFVNTLKYVAWSIIIGFLPPIILAIMVNEMVYFKQKIMTFLYLPAIIPAIAVSLLWKQMYDPTDMGLLNMILTKLGMHSYQWLDDGKFTILWIVVSMTWKGFPGAMLLYYSALQGVKQELYEAATLDGAGIVRRAWYVTRPQIMGVLILNFVRQIIGVFQVMEQPLSMTGGGPDGASASLGYQLYKYGFVTQRVGHAMALGTIIFVVLIFMTIFYFRLNKKLEESL